MRTALGAAWVCTLAAAGIGGGGRALASERVTLVGASIGKAWNLERIAERVSLPGWQFSYVGVYAFDKGPAIAEVLSRSEKPTVLAIKECATYFPGDLDAYRRSVAGWVEQIRRAGVRPMLLTTAPVAEPRSLLGRAKALAKRLLGRSTAQEGLVAFNDWLKEWAMRERVPVFDLEAVLRRSETDRWLRAEYDAGDGVHLDAAAYAAIDAAFAAFLASGAAGGAR